MLMAYLPEKVTSAKFFAGRPRPHDSANFPKCMGHQGTEGPQLARGGSNALVCSSSPERTFRKSRGVPQSRP